MGHKPSHNFQMDRPESGGADHDNARENSGLLDRAKQEFAESQQAKHAQAPREATQAEDTESQPETDPATRARSE